MGRPPVFIVVCSNTSVSKLVYDWIAGYDRTLPGGETVAAPGQAPPVQQRRRRPPGATAR